MKRRVRATFFSLTLVLIASALSSCVPLAVGAVGGYMIGNEGVRLQSPITTEPKREEYRY